MLAGLEAAGPAGLALIGTLGALALAGYAAHKGLQQFVASAERIDAASKLAERLDLTYGSLQRLTFIAGRSDVEIGALAKAMEHMGRGMGSGGMSLENRFAEQAKRIGAIKDPAIRATEAFKAFGKSGGELVPLLRNFAQDAARFDRFGGKFGFGIEDKDARNIERMNDAWSDMVFIGTQLADKFVSKFGGPVAAFLESGIGLLEDWATHLSEAGVTWEDVGGFAVSVLERMNGLMQLGNAQLQISIGFLDRVLAGHKAINAFLTGDKALKAEARALDAAGIKLIGKGRQTTEDFFSGKLANRFRDSIVNGTDLSPRGRFGSDLFGGGESSLPKALELGTSGAASAILNAGASPTESLLTKVNEGIQQLVRFEQRKDGSGIPLLPAEA